MSGFKLFQAILLLSIIPETIFSQDNFIKGFIITNTSDTVFGLIKSRADYRSYKTCTFKASEIEDAVNYKPEELAGYGFNKNIGFRSNRVLNNDSIYVFKFIEVLVEGEISLLKHGNDFYLQEGIKFLKITKRNRSRYLNTLLGNCPEIKSRLDRVSLNEKELTILIQDYNNCINKSYVAYKAEKPWFKISPGILFGANPSMLSFDKLSGYPYTTNFIVLQEQPFKSFIPMIGISFNYSWPRISERISFHSEFIYFRSIYRSFNFTDYGVFTIKDYVMIDIPQLKIPLGLRYTFPGRKFNMFFTAGPDVNFHLDPHSEWIRVTETDSEFAVKKNKALDIVKYQAGFHVGVGISKPVCRRINAYLEIGYEYTSGISREFIDPNKVEMACNSHINILRLCSGISIK